MKLNLGAVWWSTFTQFSCKNYYNGDPTEFHSMMSIIYLLGTKVDVHLYSMLLCLHNIKQVNLIACGGTGISHCIISFAAVERKAVYYSLFNQTKETYTTRDHWSLIYGQG